MCARKHTLGLTSGFISNLTIHASVLRSFEWRACAHLAYTFARRHLNYPAHVAQYRLQRY